MKIGKLRHYIELQNYYTSRNSVGEVVKVWTTYAQVWAQITPISGSQYQSGQQEDAETSHNIIARYDGQISYKDRIIFENQTYEVISVIDADKRKTYVIINAKQIEPEATASLIVDAKGHANELANYVNEAEGFNFLDTDNWLLYSRNNIAYPAGGGEPDTYYFDAPIAVDTGDIDQRQPVDIISNFDADNRIVKTIYPQSGDKVLEQTGIIIDDNNNFTTPGNVIADGMAANVLAVDGMTLYVDKLTHAVGIGTNTPNEALQVIGNIEAFNLIGTVQTASQPNIDHGSLAGKSDDDHPQYVLADGTRNVDDTLIVQATDFSYRFTVDPNNGSGPQLQLGNDVDASAYFRIGAYGGINNFDTKGRDFEIHNSNYDTLFFIDQSAKFVGINNDSPNYMFDVARDGSGNILQLQAKATSTDTRVGLKFTPSTSGSTQIGSQIEAVRTNANNSGDTDLVISNYGSGGLLEKARFKANGCFGLGVDPEHLISGYRENSGRMLKLRTSNDGGQDYELWYDAASNGWFHEVDAGRELSIRQNGGYRFHIRDDGNVGIHTTAPDYPFTVQGSSRFKGDVYTDYIKSYGNAQIDGSLTVNGNAYLDPLYPYHGKVHATLSTPRLSETATIDGLIGNKLQFLPDANIDVEYTTDGANWADAKPLLKQWQPDAFMAGAYLGQYGLQMPSPNEQGTHWQSIRLTFEAANYSNLSYLYMYTSTAGHDCSRIKIERSSAEDKNTWVSVCEDTTMWSSWPGHTMIPHSGVWHDNSCVGETHKGKYIRLTMDFNWDVAYLNNSVIIYHLNWYGCYPANVDNNRWTWNKAGNAVYDGSAIIEGDAFVDSSLYVNRIKSRNGLGNEIQIASIDKVRIGDVDAGKCLRVSRNNYSCGGVNLDLVELDSGANGVGVFVDDMLAVGQENRTAAGLTFLNRSGQSAFKNVYLSYDDGTDILQMSKYTSDASAIDFHNYLPVTHKETTHLEKDLTVATAIGKDSQKVPQIYAQYIGDPYSGRCDDIHANRLWVKTIEDLDGGGVTFSSEVKSDGFKVGADADLSNSLLDLRGQTKGIYGRGMLCVPEANATQSGSMGAIEATIKIADGVAFTAPSAGIAVGGARLGTGASNATYYGLHLSGMSTSAKNYSMYADGGDMLHAGKIKVGSTSDPSYTLDVNGTCYASTYATGMGQYGVTGSFTTNDMKTVTVTNGLITAITDNIA